MEVFNTNLWHYKLPCRLSFFLLFNNLLKEAFLLIGNICFHTGTRFLGDVQ